MERLYLFQTNASCFEVKSRSVMVSLLFCISILNFLDQFPVIKKKKKKKKQINENCK